jgi:glycosyltransferase involved in cell wall biosynthesis
MNIIFLTLAYLSSIEDKNIYTDLLREFIKNGHNVCIVSPVERRYHKKSHIIEEGNCKMLRVKIGNIQKTNIIEKGISTVLIERQYKKAFKKYLSKMQFDLVIYSTPPITLVGVIDYIKKKYKAKTYLLLKDIFPQNALDLGILSEKGVKAIFYKYFRNKEKLLYKKSDYIGCMSTANVNFVLKHNPDILPANVEVCPNSIDPVSFIKDRQIVMEVRDKYSLPKDKTIFIYGGNLGKPQGIEFLIECLKANERNHQVYFVIVGSGTEFIKLQNYIDKEKPVNVILLSQLPREEFETLTNSCDVGMIFLDHRFTIPNIPSRMLSYMQASMPILAATDKNTDLGLVMEEGNFGCWCESNNIDNFNRTLLKFIDKDLRETMGYNARKYLEENFMTEQSYEIIMKHFEEGK